MGPIKFTLIKKLKNNNRFNYTPRYYNGKEGVDTSKYATKFDAYAEAYNENDFSGQWKEARTSLRNRNNSELNITIIVIAGILLFICLWIIDFDLSIFS